ncbi:MAG TPA: isopentenyl-diphosphate Delta-isomerase [Acidimicrobiales bacterium]|nr:isopentenyl-diphosphate Delta-isomerase [Acidimicrobiales bacterium]
MTITLPSSPASDGWIDIRSGAEHVVLLDERGRPYGVRAKAAAHGPHTPLHLAFSCHVVRGDGRVLLTQRSFEKRTWPGVWTNACCGHPQLGETLGQAVLRRLREELGVVPRAVAVAAPDFTYRAAMDDGTVEHELCPVLVARVDEELRLDPSEVADAEWVTWDELLVRAQARPGTLSPWSVAQLAALADLAPSPAEWLEGAIQGPTPLLAWTPGVRAASTPAAAPERSTAFEPVLDPLEGILGRFVAEQRAELVRIDPSLAEVGDEIGRLIAAGGKRLRPAFVYWGHRATGAAHDPEVLLPAGAVELLHTFALLHDDVMDRSAVRRGQPSGHAALAARHRAEGRSGDSEWFGMSAAVLAGDLTFVWADQLFEAAALPAEAMARARRTFTTLRSEVVAGQYLDLGLAASRHGGERAAHQVAMLKSARYTVTRPLLLGAALAGRAEPELEGALRTYGDAVGVAFQMRDDVLGLFGDPAETGKGVLDDLREGKRTLLYLRALRLATPPQRTVLTARFGDPHLDEAGADRIRDVVAATGALASVEALIASRHATARAALVGLPSDARRALDELAALAIERRT